MKILIFTFASAFILALLISGCSNSNFFSNAVSKKSPEAVNAALADQAKSINDIQAEARKMSKEELKAQIDSYNLLIADKDNELATNQKRLMQISADQANIERRASLKNRITALTYQLDDLNMKQQIFTDQLKSIKK